MIMITGEEKKTLLEQAIEQGPSSKYPIGRVLAEVELPVDIHWAA
jgi:6-phosphogluconolactonase